MIQPLKKVTLPTPEIKKILINLRVQIRSPNGSLQSAEPVMKRDDTAALIAPSKNDYLFPIREEIRTTDAHLSM